MKAILLMLCALSAAIIFVGCGTAVGRATGVESSESKIAISDSSSRASGTSEDKVRSIVQEELKKYDAIKSKSEPTSQELVEQILERIENMDEDGTELNGQDMSEIYESIEEFRPILAEISNIESTVENIIDEYLTELDIEGSIESVVDELVGTESDYDPELSYPNTPVSTATAEAIENQIPEGSTCTLSDGEVVQDGWQGNDTGNNYCNSCNCNNGRLACTKMACMRIIPPTPTAMPKQ